MKLAVVGSRHITDEEFVKQEILKVCDAFSIYPEDLTIISGGAKGVDTLSKVIADGWEVDHITFKPYHLVDSKAEYHPKYFFVRNKQIVDNCDVLLAIWDGVSHGTADSVRYGLKRNKDVIDVRYIKH